MASTPTDDRAYAEMERALLANGKVRFEDPTARSEFRRLYDQTVGHYIHDMQPHYGYDLWRDDPRFRRIVLTQVHRLAELLARKYDGKPAGPQLYQAGRVVLNALYRQTKEENPWMVFALGCPIFCADAP